MKKTNLIFSAIAAVALLASSCSMQKRQYMAGYHVEWKHGKKEAVATNNSNPKKSVVHADQLTAINTPVTTASMDKELSAPFLSEQAAPVESAHAIAATGKAKSINSSIYKLSQERLSLKEKMTVVKAAKKIKKASADDISKGLYIVLAIFIPFVAVGLATDWGIEVLWNILWMLLCGFPAIIHAFIILKRKGIL